MRVHNNIDKFAHNSRYEHQRKRSRLGPAILALLFACSGHSFAQTPPAAPTDPTVDDPCAEVISFPAPGTEKDAVSHAVVVVPHEYGLKTPTTAQQKRYPVVYLLHGYGANYTNWYIRTREAGHPLGVYADRYGLILVCVDGKPASWYLDAPPDSEDPANWQVETTITRHLIPEIDRRYRTWPDARGRGVVGLSMGGHGAIFLAARHPELLSACGNMSGAIDFTHVLNKQNLSRRLGPLDKNRERWIELSAMTQAERFVGRRVGVLLDCGWSDPFFEDHRLLHEKLTRLQVRHEYIARPGAHEWPYWINALPYHLQFISDRLRPAGLPQPEKPFPSFESTVLDREMAENPRDLDIADMNADGRPDIVLAGSKSIYWCESPSWRKHVVTGPAMSDIVSIAAEDVDRDGRLDLAAACKDAVSDTGARGQVCWLRGGSTEPWEAFPVRGAADLCCIRWADVDGDARRELLGVQSSAPPSAATRLLAMHVPAKPETDAWNMDPISDNLHIRGALLPLRFFAAPSEQFLACGDEGVHVFHRDPIDGKWIDRQLGSGDQENTGGRGTREMAMGRLREGPRFLATIEPGHDHEIVVYLEPPYSDQPWPRLVIDRTSGDAHGVACADMDGDGDDEIAAGFSNSGGQPSDSGLKAYKAASDSAIRWEGRWIEKGTIAVAALRVADLNGDKLPDIVVAGSAPPNVKAFLGKP